jgi:5'-3' exoribonuclease 2
MTLNMFLLLITVKSRQNPPGAFSGRQMGDAAHRLVRNSLQVPRDPAQYPYDAAMSADRRDYGHSRDYRDRREYVPNSRSYGYPSSSSHHYYDQSQYGTQPAPHSYYADGGYHQNLHALQHGHRAPYGANYSEQQNYRHHHPNNDNYNEHSDGGRGSYGRGQGQQRSQHNNYNNNRYGTLDRSSSWRHQPPPPGNGRR